MEIKGSPDCFENIPKEEVTELVSVSVLMAECETTPCDCHYFIDGIEKLKPIEPIHIAIDQPERLGINPFECFCHFYYDDDYIRLWGFTLMRVSGKNNNLIATNVFPIMMDPTGGLVNFTTNKFDHLIPVYEGRITAADHLVKRILTLDLIVEQNPKRIYLEGQTLKADELAQRTHNFEDLE
ncbi:MAG: hypothetical protein F6K55_03075 [Moorea sp. SIO4A3]|nr:hypothetical protein [Moorena sp. SIO4A3]